MLQNALRRAVQESQNVSGLRAKRQTSRRRERFALGSRPSRTYPQRKRFTSCIEGRAFSVEVEGWVVRGLGGGHVCCDCHCPLDGVDVGWGSLIREKSNVWLLSFAHRASHRGRSSYCQCFPLVVKSVRLDRCQRCLTRSSSGALLVTLMLVHLKVRRHWARGVLGPGQDRLVRVRTMGAHSRQRFAGAHQNELDVTTTMSWTICCGLSQG